MSVRIMADVWASSMARGNDRLVLLALADHANDEDRTAWPSIAHLAGKCRLGRSTVKRAIMRLALRGEVVVTPVGTGKVNRYTLWDPVHRVNPVQSEPGSPVDRPPGPVGEPGVVHSCEPLNHQEPSRSKPSRKRRRSVDTDMPDPFELDGLEPKWREEADKGGLDAKYQFGKWKAWCRANGRRYADWFAGWQTWCRNAWEIEERHRQRRHFT